MAYNVSPFKLTDERKKNREKKTRLNGPLARHGNENSSVLILSVSHCKLCELLFQSDSPPSSE